MATNGISKKELISKLKPKVKKMKSQWRKDFTKKYHYYKDQYLKAQKKAISKGFAMADVMMDKKTFKTIYKKYHDQALKEIEEGDKKAVGNIIKNIVGKQTRVVSKKQAQAVARAARGSGYNVTSDEIEYEGLDIVPDDFWKDISKEYHSLIKNGVDPQQASSIISTEWFNS